MLFREEDKAVLECILFASVEAVTIGQLTKAMDWKKEEASELLRILQLDYLTRNSGLELAEVAGGWKLRTKAEHAAVLEKFFKPLRNRLTKAALETLAIIAYNQPITKMDIENIRSVKVDSVVSNLLEKGLIQEDGRKNSPGRPILYAVSAEFLQHFGINSVEDLPPLPPAEEG